MSSASRLLPAGARRKLVPRCSQLTDSGRLVSRRSFGLIVGSEPWNSRTSIRDVEGGELRRSIGETQFGAEHNDVILEFAPRNLTAAAAAPGNSEPSAESSNSLRSLLSSTKLA